MNIFKSKTGVRFGVAALTIFGLAAFYFYYTTGQHLQYADAISRLNIARKVVDNLTPGLAQVGNVWLPLPQILMLPFIWNYTLWQTGIAGAIMSVSAFILGGYFIYKTGYIISQSKLASFLGMLIYALNINILYLQSTAMSEAVFLCTLAASTFYFVQWMKTEKKYFLILAAAWVAAMTLTRYEGLAILLPSIPMVFLYTILKTRKYQRAEGTTLIYTVLACVGFGAWTLYLAMIFGDPLYWKTYYASGAVNGGVETFSQAKPFMAAVWQYFTSFVWMIGLIPTIFTILGLLALAYKTIKDRTWYFFPILMPLAIFLFMVLTLQRNTPIVQPALTLANIMRGETSMGTGFNIRYGLLLLPWAAVMSTYLFAVLRPAFLKIVIFAFFGIQIYSYFVPNYSVIYQIPARNFGKPYQDMVEWMKKNYDGGLILISASSHEDQMFAMGFDYKNYIHEGTNRYWKESLDNPSRYSKWVVRDPGHKEDQVARHMNRIDILDREYKLMYNRDQVRIYKKITDPYFKVIDAKSPPPPAEPVPTFTPDPSAAPSTETGSVEGEYKYTAARRESYTALARKALADYAKEKSVTFPRGEQTYLETSLVAEKRNVPLEIGQEVVFTKAKIEELIKTWESLTPGVQARWNRY